MLTEINLPHPLTPSHQGRGIIAVNFSNIFPVCNTKSKAKYPARQEAKNRSGKPEKPEAGETPGACLSRPKGKPLVDSKSPRHGRYMQAVISLHITGYYCSIISG